MRRMFGVVRVDNAVIAAAIAAATWCTSLKVGAWLMVSLS
jgi:hypothetical protein